MTTADNPYRAPETSIVEPRVDAPRPFFMFLAAAICCGAGVLFLLLTMVLVVGFVRAFLREDWEWYLTTKLGHQILVSSIFSMCCLITFMVAARSFFIGKGRRGLRFLLAAIVGVCLFVAAIQFGVI